MDGWIDGWMDGWMNEQMDQFHGWMDKWNDLWMDDLYIFSLHYFQTQQKIKLKKKTISNIKGVTLHVPLAVTSSLWPESSCV